MKLYRVQVRFLGVYLDHKVEAEKDENVIDNFIKQLSSGAVELQKEQAGILKHKCLVTYEEVSDGQNRTGAHR